MYITASLILFQLSINRSLIRVNLVVKIIHILDNPKILFLNIFLLFLIYDFFKFIEYFISLFISIITPTSLSIF